MALSFPKLAKRKASGPRIFFSRKKIAARNTSLRPRRHLFFSRRDWERENKVEIWLTISRYWPREKMEIETGHY
jgi:hypothetical protein